MAQGMREATEPQPNVKQAIKEVDAEKPSVTAQEIESAWSDFQKTGRVHPLFDDPTIVGTAYDIRRYTPELMQAFRNVAELMPQVLKKQQPVDVLIEPLNLIYEKNINKVVGQKDKSGKVIAKATLSRLNLLSDIDPKQAGDQPGLVLAIEVFYEDGSSGGVRPVTKSRSTEDDDVLVIPLQSAIGDLSGQLALARKLMNSEHYQSLFSQQPQPTQQQGSSQPQQPQLTEQPQSQQQLQPVAATGEQ